AGRAEEARDAQHRTGPGRRPAPVAPGAGRPPPPHRRRRVHRPLPRGEGARPDLRREPPDDAPVPAGAARAGRGQRPAREDPAGADGRHRAAHGSPVQPVRLRRGGGQEPAQPGPRARPAPGPAGRGTPGPRPAGGAGAPRAHPSGRRHAPRAGPRLAAGRDRRPAARGRLHPHRALPGDGGADRGRPPPGAGGDPGRDAVRGGRAAARGARGSSRLPHRAARALGRADSRVAHHRRARRPLPGELAVLPLGRVPLGLRHARRRGCTGPTGRDRMTWLLAVAVGALLGLTLGALGAGGSILAVPALVYLLGQSPQQATTSSLVIVGATAAVAATQHARRGRVRWRVGAMFAAAGIPASLAGTALNGAVDGAVILIAFAVVMALSAASMLWRTRRGSPRQDASGPPSEAQARDTGTVSGSRVLR